MRKGDTKLQKDTRDLARAITTLLEHKVQFSLSRNCDDEPEVLKLTIEGFGSRQKIISKYPIWRANSGVTKIDRGRYILAWLADSLVGWAIFREAENDRRFGK